MTGEIPQLVRFCSNLVVDNTNFTYLDTLTWVKGRNQFKFGTQIVRNRDNKGANFQSLIYYTGLGDPTNPAPLTLASDIPYGSKPSAIRLPASGTP